MQIFQKYWLLVIINSFSKYILAYKLKDTSCKLYLLHMECLIVDHCLFRKSFDKRCNIKLSNYSPRYALVEVDHNVGELLLVILDYITQHQLLMISVKLFKRNRQQFKPFQKGEFEDLLEF